MLELAPFIRDLTLILGIAGIALILCQKLRQPVVLGYLIAGIIIGPYTPPHLIIYDVATIKVIAELGVIFLMFALGIEFSFHKLQRIGAPSAITGIIEVAFMLLSGYGLGKILGWPDMESLFLGATLSISSTTIIIKTLNDLALNKSAFAELIFGVLIIEDLLAILLLVGLSTAVVTSSATASAQLVMAAVKLILTVGGWFIVGYFVIPTLFRTWLKAVSNEILIVIAVALCLSLVLLAAHFHYSIALGAFIMGSILAETQESERIEHLIQPLRDIFAAVFFVSVGMLIDPHVIWENWLIILIITGFTIVSKLVFSFMGAWLSGQRLDTSLQVGFSMAQIGEFSFIIASLGMTLGVISSVFYPVIVAISLITSFTTPYFIKYSLIISRKLQKHHHDHHSLFTRESMSQQLSFHEVNYIKSLSTRFIINAILIAIIFILIETLILPALIVLIPNTNFLFMAVFLANYIPAAPFIWASLHAGTLDAPSIRAQKIAWLFCLIFTSVELYILIHSYFGNMPLRLTFIGLALIFSMIMHSTLKHAYIWLELHLKGNLKKL